MKYVIGALLISIGFFHGLHVFDIEIGSVINLNGNRFFSFASLDRIASTGFAGKVAVLIIDGILVLLGFLEITGLRLHKIFIKKLIERKQ